MFGAESLGGNAQAAVLIGAVLVEAAVPYVGYGALAAVLGRRVTALIGGR
jgi:hypothetical protein